MNKITALLWGLCLTGIASLIILFSTIISVKKINQLPMPDKLYHAGAYAVLAFLLSGLLRSLTNHHLSSIVMEAVTIATLFGVAMEFAQFFIPRRTADIADVCANIIGACLGATAFYVVYKLLYS